MHRETGTQIEAPLTSAEVAQMFHVSRETVNRWIRTGRLASFRTPGGHHRHRRGDVEALRAAVQGRWGA